MEKERILSELHYRTSRSGGSGGQNVNKVETKVEVLFNISTSTGLREVEKSLILEKLSSKLSQNGELSVISQTERTQVGNKRKAEQRLMQILVKATFRNKKRIPVSVPRQVVQNRLNTKRLRSMLKQSRSKPLPD
jgi:ribosome-associated protein